jgi:hypothetical protein
MDGAILPALLQAARRHDDKHCSYRFVAPVELGKRMKKAGRQHQQPHFQHSLHRLLSEPLHDSCQGM